MKISQKKNGFGSVGKVAGVVAAACLEMACAGGQLRPTPPPEECPPGAVEAMLNQLRMTSRRAATFFPIRSMRYITVKEGPVSLAVWEPWGKLPAGTQFFGRLIFGPGRVYGRFTEARTPEGRFPVCVELMEQDGSCGLESKIDEGSNTARIFSTVDLKRVLRFE